MAPTLSELGYLGVDDSEEMENDGISLSEKGAAYFNEKFKESSKKPEFVVGSAVKIYGSAPFQENGEPKQSIKVIGKKATAVFLVSADTDDFFEKA